MKRSIVVYAITNVKFKSVAIGCGVTFNIICSCQIYRIECNIYNKLNLKTGLVYFTFKLISWDVIEGKISKINLDKLTTVLNLDFQGYFTASHHLFPHIHTDITVFMLCCWSLPVQELRYVDLLDNPCK